MIAEQFHVTSLQLLSFFKNDGLRLTLTDYMAIFQGSQVSNKGSMVLLFIIDLIFLLTVTLQGVSNKHCLVSFFIQCHLTFYNCVPSVPGKTTYNVFETMIFKIKTKRA